MAIAPRPAAIVSAIARPFGLAQMQDGSVLLGDEQNGILYRITYSK